ncbi:MAG: prolipoprotein diacylglyceryl transferase [Alphaproteobacteria bacterium]|nr:prolipoprotein diacylglyceryl transferase [Alphaproteobacteria bacterium]MBL6938638.1 prolipoprotein diacylglyceryl transferase [Alphaproteobacteria bacterium]MBL7098005.1 prolipoprotein diacylglyceryl transferase [Alphaproteobacteria bacterium]
MPYGLLPYPKIDPTLFSIGPLAIRWYALSYIAGLLAGWWLAARMTREKALWRNPTFANKPPMNAEQVGDLVVWATVGVIAGGRLGWILFYGIALCLVSPQTAMCHVGDGVLPGAFVTNPMHLITTWEGGMSFHGGLAGVALALWLFCRRNKLPLLSVADMIAVVAPVGLFFGRLANFINGELWGKPTDVPWAMIFPRAPDHIPTPRHPSQLYEAALEGVVLFLLLQIGLRYFKLHERPGLLTGLFFLGYGVFRFFVEFFREPDGPFLGWFSMGMALSIPLWLAAAAFLWVSLKPRGRG